MVVFGLLSHVNVLLSTLVFVGLLFFLTILEYTLQILDVWAEINNSTHIFNKLKYELMVLGILSFLIFIIDAAISIDPNSEVFHAFELAHIIVLFIAFSFVVQALFLAQFAKKRARYFLRTVRTTESELLHEYKLLVLQDHKKLAYEDDIQSEISLYHQDLTNESKRQEAKDQDNHEETDNFKTVSPPMPTIAPIRKFSNSNVFSLRKDSSPFPASDENSKIEIPKKLSFAEQMKDGLIEIHDRHLQPVFHKDRFKIFWRKIEFKIIEELFLLCHHLPREFNFGTYTSYRFQHYIAEVGNISSLSWFMLIVLVLLNLGVQRIIDAVVHRDRDCVHHPEEACYYILFTYSLFLDSVINIIVIIIYLFSTFYEHMLIRKGMKEVFEVDIDQGEHNRLKILYHAVNEACGINSHDIHTNEVHVAYIRCLALLDNLKNKESTSLMVPSQVRSQYLKSSYRMRSSTFIPDTSVVKKTATDDKVKRSEAPEVTMDRLKKIKQNIYESEMRSIHKHELQKQDHSRQFKLKKQTKKGKVKHTNKGYFERMYLYWKRYFYSYTPHSEHFQKNKIDSKTKQIFAFSSPSLYFFIVEFTFLLQSFYLAVYLTQLLPLAVYFGNDYNSGIGALWGIVLLISPLIGLYFLRLILQKSVLLHATVYLHIPLVGKVCDETILEVTLVQEVRSKIMKTLDSAIYHIQKKQIDGGVCSDDEEEEEDDNDRIFTIFPQHYSSSSSSVNANNNSAGAVTPSIDVVSSNKQSDLSVAPAASSANNSNKTDNNSSSSVINVKRGFSFVSPFTTSAGATPSTVKKPSADESNKTESSGISVKRAFSFASLKDRFRPSFVSPAGAGVTEVVNSNKTESINNDGQITVKRGLSFASAATNRIKKSMKNNSTKSEGDTNLVNKDHASLTHSAPAALSYPRHKLEKIKTIIPFSNATESQTQSPVPPSPTHQLLSSDAESTPHYVTSALTASTHNYDHSSLRPTSSNSLLVPLVTTNSGLKLPRKVSRTEEVFLPITLTSNSGSTSSSKSATAVVVTPGKIHDEKSDELSVADTVDKNDVTSLKRTGSDVATIFHAKHAATTVVKESILPPTTHPSSSSMPRAPANSSVDVEPIKSLDSSGKTTIRRYSRPGGLTTIEKQKVNFIRSKYEEIDLDGSGEINRLEFRQFLDSMNVFLSREKFKLLWRAVDEDMSGSISADEIFLFVFPDKKWALRDELSIAKNMREQVLKYLQTEKQAQAEQWADILHEKFIHVAEHDNFDNLKDDNGTSGQDLEDVLNIGGKRRKTFLKTAQVKNKYLMTLTDLRLLLADFNVKTDGKEFNLLLSIVKLEDDKLVSYSVFCEFVLLPEYFQIIFPNPDVTVPVYDDSQRQALRNIDSSIQRDSINTSHSATLFNMLADNVSTVFDIHRQSSKRRSSMPAGSSNSHSHDSRPAPSRELSKTWSAVSFSGIAHKATPTSPIASSTAAAAVNKTESSQQRVYRPYDNDPC